MIDGYYDRQVRQQLRATEDELGKARKRAGDLQRQLTRTEQVLAAEEQNSIRELRAAVTAERYVAEQRARAETAEARLAALHQGEEPYEDERVLPTPGQWLWWWNRATPTQRLERAERALADAEHVYTCFMNAWPERAREAEARVSEFAARAEQAEADRDQLAAGVPLVCSDERHHARVRGLQAQLGAVRAIHTAEFGNEFGARECSTCRETWPCRTVAALDGPAVEPLPVVVSVIVDGQWQTVPGVTSVTINHDEDEDVPWQLPGAIDFTLTGDATIWHQLLDDMRAALLQPPADTVFGAGARGWWANSMAEAEQIERAKAILADYLATHHVPGLVPLHSGEVRDLRAGSTAEPLGFLNTGAATEIVAYQHPACADCGLTAHQPLSCDEAAAIREEYANHLQTQSLIISEELARTLLYGPDPVDGVEYQSEHTQP